MAYKTNAETRSKLNYKEIDRSKGLGKTGIFALIQVLIQWTMNNRLNLLIFY